MRKRLTIFAAAAAAVLAAGAALAAVGTSRHNVETLTGVGQKKGICDACHIPHGAQGAKLFRVAAGATIRNMNGNPNQVSGLCATCHATLVSLTVGQGIFTADVGFQTHMTGMASGGTIHQTSSLWTDTPGAWPSSSFDDGFDCLTCHDVHEEGRVGYGNAADPGVLGDAHGFFLRGDQNNDVDERFTSTGADGFTLGDIVGDFTQWCQECHNVGWADTGNAQGHHIGGCATCHEVHQGYVRMNPAGDPTDSSGWMFIFRENYPGSFAAAPNVSTLDDIGTRACVGCHSAGAIGGSGTDTKTIAATTEHHPMGMTLAAAAASLHVDAATPALTGTSTGTTPGLFACISCHNMHDATSEYYLRLDANGDGTPVAAVADSGSPGAWCAECHAKTVANLDLAANNNGHRQTAAGWLAAIYSDGVGNTEECTFCHSVHYIPNVPGAAAAGNDFSVDAILRRGLGDLEGVAPATWGGGLGGTIANNSYAGLCMACHMNTAIVGDGASGGSNDAYMDPTTDFSHKASSFPVSNAVLTNMQDSGLNIYLGGGGGDGTADMYGIANSEMTCYTCHNVHVQNANDEALVFGGNAPGGNYLRRDQEGSVGWDAGGVNQGTDTPGGGATAESAFTFNDARMCIACHDSSAGPAGTTHPLEANVNTAVTRANWPAGVFANVEEMGGGRTVNGNNTGPISCLSCHNMHFAATDTAGTGNTGKLMISTNAASALCLLCHDY